jgi:hypothetical protein
MSEAIEKAAAAIHAAEQHLRSLMQASIDGGNYEEITILARWAECLAAIPTDPAGGGDTCGEQTGIRPLRAARAVPRSQLPPRSAVARKKKYPFFQRAGEHLVKTAWSKSDRDEYEHRCPKAVAFELLRRMRELSRNQELITMDDVLPLQIAGEELPPYQGYVSLAWLRHIGAVKQHGRHGYSLVDGRDSNDLERAWGKLPRHKQ